MRYLFAIVLAIVATSVSAKQINLATRLSPELGLNSIAVNNVFQGPSGLLWMVTPSAIGLYDGHQISPLELSSVNILEYYIIKIKPTNDNKVWMSLGNKGLLEFDPVTHQEKLIYSTVLDEYISDFGFHQQFNQLITTNKKLFYRDDKEQLVELYDFTTVLGSSNQITSLQSNQTHIYIGTTDGLKIYDIKAQKLLATQAGNSSAIKDMLLYKHQLFLNYAEYVVKLNLAVLSATNQDGLPNIEGHKLLTGGSATLALKGNALYLGSVRGVFRYETVNSTLTQLFTFADVEPRLYSGKPMSMAFDNNGLLWMGTLSDGPIAWDPKAIQFDQYRAHELDQDSIIGNDIWALFSNQTAPDSLWVGTATGLSVIHRDSGTVERHPLALDENENKLAPSFIINSHFSNSAVFDIGQSSDGNLWLNTLFGIKQYDPMQRVSIPINANNKVLETLAENQDDMVLANDMLWGLYWDKPRQLSYLYRFDTVSGEYDPLTPLNQLVESGVEITDLYGHVLDDQRFFIATLTSLLSYDTITGEIDHVFTSQASTDDGSNYLDGMVYDERRNILWIASVKQGLVGIDATSFEVKHILADENAANKAIVYNPQIDQFGNLWFASLHGIFQVDLDTFTLQRFTTGNGLLLNEFNGTNGAQLSNGSLAFGSLLGVTLFNAQAPTSDFKQLPTVVITATNYPVESEHPKALVHADTAHITLPSKHEPLEINYSALNFHQGIAARFNVTIQSGNQQNQFTTDEYLLRLPQLTWGSHKIKIAHISSDNGQLSTPFILTVTVMRPTWLSNPLLAVYGILFIVLLYVLSRFSSRKVIRTNRRIRRLVKARTKALSEANSQLESAVYELQQANSAKERFVANMSHEIRTPLTTIIGYTEQLETQRITGDEVPRALSLIKDSGHHLLNVINSILDLSKLNAGKLQFTRDQVELRPLLNNVQKVTSYRAKAKHLPLVIELINPLPNYIVSDATRLQQVLVNLCDNAIKFTDSGQVKLTVRVNKSQLEITVSDTGIGMSSEQLARLFSPFEQAENNANRRYSGSGLGLSIAKQLTETLGGSIVASSQLGAGSSFKLTLPLPDGERLTPAAAPDITGSSLDEVAFGDLSSQMQTAPTDEVTILVVDDVQSTIELVELILRKQGYRVLSAENGKDALKVLQQEPTTQLVLMDIQMPIMDGITALKQFRQWNQSTPVIAFTANNMTHEIEYYLNEGFAYCIKKPIERVELKNTIARFIKTPSVNNSSATAPSVAEI